MTLESNKAKIQSFYRKHRRMPSYSEITQIAGFRSKNAAYKLVQKLVKMGVMAKDATGRLTPRRLHAAIPLLGVVEAGWPSPAEEELLDTMTLDDFLIRNKEATYMLKVKGDSMIDAGILAGDQVLVERGVEPKDGDIVIAEVDGKWTMKYFRKHASGVVLVPANRKYNTIIPKQELTIAAVVRAVIRRY